MEKSPTFVVTLRSDMRDAATVLGMLKDAGIEPNNPSQLVSFALELLSELAQSKGYKKFTSTEEALNYLQAEGIIGEPSKLRNYKTLLKTLSAESIVEEKAPVPTFEDLAKQAQERLNLFKEEKKAFGNAPAGLVVKTEEEDK